MTMPSDSAPWNRPASASGDAIARLEKQVRSARALAVLGVVVGLFSLGLTAYSLSRTPTAAAPAQPAATTAPAATPEATVTIGKPADAGAAPAGSIVLKAKAASAPVLDIYEDFQCPACASVEKVLGPQVDALVAAGTVEVRFHVMSFLDQNLRNDSSTRSANGGFCAHDQGKFMAWHDTLFAPASRPAEEGVGWTDAQLKQFATTAGLDVTAWSTCVASGTHAAAVTAAEDTSMAAGVQATPTYKLNGTTLDLNAVMAAGGLQAFIAANA